MEQAPRQTDLDRLQAVTFWIQPGSPHSPLASASICLERLLAVFYQAFPEYNDTLAYVQSARWPHNIFLSVSDGCSGMLPGAACHLRYLLLEAFPKCRVQVYGKHWSPR